MKPSVVKCLGFICNLAQQCAKRQPFPRTIRFPEAGHQITLTGPLGRGRTGTTFVATYKNKPVALKIADIWKSSWLEPEVVCEQKVYQYLASLQGQCIPTMKFLWKSEGFILFATTLVIRSPFHWTLKAAQKTLRAIHSAGVLHGDIRCENILRSTEGPVFFIDLGFSTEIEKNTASAKFTEENKELNRVYKECQEKHNKEFQIESSTEVGDIKLHDHNKVTPKKSNQTVTTSSSSQQSVQPFPLRRKHRKKFKKM